MSYSTVGALPRQLTLPSWLRNLVASHVGAAVKGTTVSIPTGTGTVSFDITNPATWDQIAKTIRGIKIVPPPTVGPEPATRNPVDAIPGGWGTLAVLGIVGFFVLPKLMGRRA